LAMTWYSGIPTVKPGPTKGTSQMGSPQGTMQDIETGLQLATGFLPNILSVLANFWPPAGILLKFLPVIQAAIAAIQAVSQSTGASALTASAQVVDHLTPGAPNHPALSADQGASGA